MLLSPSRSGFSFDGMRLKFVNSCCFKYFFVFFIFSLFLQDMRWYTKKIDTCCSIVFLYTERLVTAACVRLHLLRPYLLQSFAERNDICPKFSSWKHVLLVNLFNEYSVVIQGKRKAQHSTLSRISDLSPKDSISHHTVGPISTSPRCWISRYCW